MTSERVFVSSSPRTGVDAGHLAQCREHFLTALDRVDEALFDLAEKAESTGNQAALIEALRTLRRSNTGFDKDLEQALATMLGPARQAKERAPWLAAMLHLETAMLELDVDTAVREELCALIDELMSGPHAAPGLCEGPESKINNELGSHRGTLFGKMSLTAAPEKGEPRSHVEAYEERTPAHEREAMADEPANATHPTQRSTRIRAARDTADSEIDSRLGRHVLDPLINDLLSNAWNSVLVLKLLRHGPNSQRYKDALAFSDDLIWTSLPKASAADVARLQSMLPQLSRNLRAGLEIVAFSEAEIVEVFARLKAIYQQQIDERYRDKLHMPSVKASGPLTRSDEGQPIALRPVEIDAPASGPSAGRRAGTYVRAQVEGLKPGAWMEFAGEDGHRIRAKLSWVSPISKKYLFVTQAGTKLADKTFNDLADEVARGETLLLRSAPIFQSSTRPKTSAS